MVLSLGRRTAATVCAVVAAASLTAMAPAAQGQGQAQPRAAHPSRVVSTDGAGDVWEFTPRTEESHHVRHFARADLTRMTASYGPHALRIRMRFLDLRRVGTELFWNEIRTPRYHLQAVLTAKPGHRQGERYFQGDDGSRSCKGFTRRIDYRRDTVQMRVPSSCLHDAGWLKVFTYIDYYRHQQGPNYFDQPFSHRSPVAHPADWTVYRPRG